MKKSYTITVVKILFALYIALVFFLCLYNFTVEEISISETLFGIRLDKYIHFTMFFPFPFISWIFFEYNTPLYSNKRYHFYRDYRFTTIILLGVILAVLTEAGQEYLTAKRESDVFDIVADFLGILTGTIVVFFTKAQIKRAFNYIFRVTL